MFHHFHNNKFLKSQGSITKNDLVNIIEYIGPKNILSAELWLEKFLKNQLNPSEVCITFDHGLKCQFEIAFSLDYPHKSYSSIFKCCSAQTNNNILSFFLDINSFPITSI